MHIYTKIKSILRDPKLIYTPKIGPNRNDIKQDEFVWDKQANLYNIN